MKKGFIALLIGLLMLSGCGASGSASSVGKVSAGQNTIVTVPVGPTTYQLLYTGNDMKGLLLSQGGEMRCLSGEDALSVEPFFGKPLDSLDNVLDDLGISRKEITQETVEGDPELILAKMQEEFYVNQKPEAKPEKPETPAEPADHSSGRWTLMAYDLSFYDITLYFEDGVLYKCDYIFSKSGEEEDKDEMYYEGDTLSECEYYGMTLEEIEAAINQMSTDYGLNVRWAKTQD